METKILTYALIAALFMGMAFAEPSAVARSLSSTAPDPCSSLTVTLAVSVNSTDTFYAIDEAPPAGWAITSPGTGSVSPSGHIKWLTYLSAVSTSLSYTITVPCNAAGTNEFSGEYGFNDAIVHPILGQSSVAIPVQDNSTNSTSGGDDTNHGSAAPSSGGSTSSSTSGGGSIVGGSGSPTSTRSTTDVNVDVGGTQCIVTIEREMESSNTSSVLTTTLTNTGGSECNMANFVFTDAVPSDFAQMGEISFSPQYTSASGASVTYAFPTFAGGESKTLTYSVLRWVSPRRANDFTGYSMSAQKPVPAAPPAAPAPEAPLPVQEPTLAPPAKALPQEEPMLAGANQPPANENLLAGALFDSNGSISLVALAALAIGLFVALALVLFMMQRKARRN